MLNWQRPTQGKDLVPEIFGDLGALNLLWKALFAETPREPRTSKLRAPELSTVITWL